MKKEIADRWVEALESGKYPQTKGRLRDSDGFCCLGVLCELAVADGVAKSEEHKLRSFSQWRYQDATGGDLSFSRLPVVVKEWAGMNSEGGTRSGRKRKLWELNDNSGYSFKRIAKVIRNEYEEL